jgi:hypothetical protein
MKRTGNARVSPASNFVWSSPAARAFLIAEDLVSKGSDDMQRQCNGGLGRNLGGTNFIMAGATFRDAQGPGLRTPVWRVANRLLHARNTGR